MSKKNGLVRYTAYAFPKDDQDPAVSALFASTNASDRELAKTSGGVSRSTITRWRNGRTRMPQLATLAAVGSGANFRGYDWDTRRMIKRGKST